MAIGQAAVIYRKWLALLAIPVCLLAAGAWANGVQALNDGPRGVTCSNYSMAGGLRWQRQLGDWLDRDGVLHGDKPYAIARVGGAALSAGISFEITELTRDWLAYFRPNTGVLFRGLDGSGTVRIDSRETVDGTPPRLELLWLDGSTSVHSPSADTTLDCSTFKSLGASKSLSVSSDKNVLVVFDLPERDHTALQRATVVLSPSRFFGRSLQIGAFSTQPPWAEESVADLAGIASGYKNDEGIAAHPQVLHHTNFTSADWQQVWTALTRVEISVVQEDKTNGFVPLQGPALRATLREGQNNGLNLRYLFAQHHGDEPDEIYFRYHIRLGDDWSPDLDGGKLPGIAGTYGRAGWGMRKSDGTNGWSVRGAFSKRTLVGPQGMAVTPIGSYVYHADMRGQSGAHWGWGQGPGGLLRNNQWYSIEQHVRLNTPGRQDGVFRAWIDGHLVYSRDNVNFRSVSDLRIESIWLNVYHGGVRPSPRDMSLYIDNVVIAREYIGPMRTTSPG